MLIVLIMVFTVDVLLLFASSRFLGMEQPALRLLAGALVHTAFVGCSLLSGFSFLSGIWWRLLALMLAALAFCGLSVRVISMSVLFGLLHLSLNGIAQGTDELRSMLLGAAGMAFAGLAKGRGNMLIPVELSLGDRTLRFTALKDTGNALRDPVTGRPVLVVESKVAGALTGLTPEALENPIESIGTIPGLRLIPYKTVGNTGFLLAMQIPEAKIGDRRGSAVVAFSPRAFESHYQALTGGTL